MRTRRMLAALAATLVGLAGTLLLAPAPARAGNWAATLLDPLPERLEPGRAYTVGLWVLQHGFHPYEGDLGPVALRFTDESGTSVSFSASALPEPAHYAAAVTVPRAGTWEVTAVQGEFADFRIGTLTLPGALEVFRVPAPLQPAETAKHWPGAIRPPELPVDPDRNPFALDPVSVQGSAVAPAAVEASAGAVPAGPERATSRRALLVAGTLLAVALVGLGVTAGRRRLRRTGRPAADVSIKPGT
ncbi:hypothetical protein O7626_11700 [Micromonospora sp. WMMD1102]|uniref:hypothetical protein n=1 Tax=Micromonospora sp. WMMD1102 TaxID=3016105 RepID=UPI0024150F37|nr:hypothetical protein [Micromonospora sp. WMMD1102]MDG4786586.1 hypothetical protein [Micromonospora sp. WMMD1102]